MNDFKIDWPRCMALVDMKSFFASIEQLDNPSLRGKPVVVVNGNQGSTIITSSYEARAFGIKTGTKLREARFLCPDLICCPTRPERYAAISSNIMQALEMNITPDIEVASIDECYLDLSGVLSQYKSVKSVAEKIREVVNGASQGLPCSIGISEGKLTAKFCAETNKGGITIVSPAKIADFMKNAPISSIAGIGRNVGRYLNRIGVQVCGDMRNILSQ